MNKKIVTILLISFLILSAIIIWLLYTLNYIPHRKYSNEHFNIKTYTSSMDKGYSRTL